MGVLDGKVAIVTGAGRGNRARDRAPVRPRRRQGRGQRPRRRDRRHRRVARRRRGGGRDPWRRRRGGRELRQRRHHRRRQGHLRHRDPELRRLRHPGQQRRHPARPHHLQDGRGRLGRRHRRPPQGPLQLLAAVRPVHPRHQPPELPHHLLLVGVGPLRQLRPVQLRRGQGRHRRLHARARARARQVRLHRQHHLARRLDPHDHRAARGARRQGRRRRARSEPAPDRAGRHLALLRGRPGHERRRSGTSCRAGSASCSSPR